MKKKPLFLPLLTLSILFFISLSCSLPKLETTIGPTSTVPALADLLGQPTTNPMQAEQENLPTHSTSIWQTHSLPTPDPYHQVPAIRKDAVEYVVKVNDTLEKIAAWYWVGVNTIIEANQIENPNLIQPGDILLIPAPIPKPTGPSFKILPDSEVVYGPSTAGFDVSEFVSDQNGFLSTYSEEIEGEPWNGAQIILRVAQDYSVGPRLLLALLEYRTGWVTQPSPGSIDTIYPLGYANTSYKGLYRQLAWAANEINRGYYLWRVNAVPGWVLSDSSVVPPDPGINAGTAGIQNLLAKLLDYPNWLNAVSENGLFNQYIAMFGFPFDMAYEPLTPINLQQPALILPFEPGNVWRFTGGPHGAFGGGTAWAALDFAPPGEALGCVQSDAWVTAMADGWVVRSGRGQVIQDLDGDGSEQTGWVLQYLHIETRDRIPAGVFLYAGERIGHPSCEGGISTGTHVHIARRYNGEWISADSDLPFNLEGWISAGTGIAYNGYLSKNGQVVTAITGNRPENQISR